MISDELICAACEGDKDAREAVLVYLYPKFRPIVRRRLPEADREDVQHKAMQAMLRKMATHAPRDAEAFEGWARSYLHMQIKNHWSRLYAKLEHKAAYGHAVRVQPKTSWFSQRQHKRQQQLLRRLLRKLATIYRSPIEHHLKEGSDRSYARKHEIATPTVRGRRFEGRRRLREMLAAYLLKGTLAPSTSS